MLYFNSDYMEGAHPEILRRLSETNLEKTKGYGTDEYCESAREKIRHACGTPSAEVFFLTGGTQTNASVINALLCSYEGVVSADSGHIGNHEAGAIEFGGHKVLTIKGQDGKLCADAVLNLFRTFYEDDNRDHMVFPGMVYLSHPTEYGTLYTKAELEAISSVCRTYKAALYLDGARLGYGLVAEGTDVTLKTIADNCDVFYIGGTKVGALFGEAVVLTKPGRLPHFLTIMKQHGALLAKGRLLGIQFDTLFTDELYMRISKNANTTAQLLKEAFMSKGYRLYNHTDTNQIFVILENTKMEQLSKAVGFNFWEKQDETHTVVRFATSWATTEEEVRELIALL